MDEGKSKAACPKLEESQRLDPGTGTLWHLARCYQETKRLARAWATFHQVAQEAQRLGEKAKVKAALDRAKKLAPKLHKLRIEVPEESRVPGLSITRGEVIVGEGAWDAPIPVDTGDLLVEATAKGYRSWSDTIEVSGKAREHKVTVPPLKKVSPKVAKPIETPPKKKKPNAERWYQDYLAWTILATGVATAAGGGGAFAYAGGLADDAEVAVDLGERDRLFDSVHRYEVTGGVLLATGGSIALVGAVLLALTPSNGDTEDLARGLLPSIRLDAESATFGLSRHF